MTAAPILAACIVADDRDLWLGLDPMPDYQPMTATSEPRGHVRPLVGTSRNMPLHRQYLFPRKVIAARHMRRYLAWVESQDWSGMDTARIIARLRVGADNSAVCGLMSF